MEMVQNSLGGTKKYCRFLSQETTTFFVPPEDGVNKSLKPTLHMDGRAQNQSEESIPYTIPMHECSVRFQALIHYA